MSREFQACWFSDYPPATADNLRRLSTKHPWIPNDYLEFLRNTDGVVLETFVFYGTADGHDFPMSGRGYYVDPYGPDDWIAVGHDAAGDGLLIGRSGGVASVGSDPPPDNPVPVCDTFHELIESVCCGERYSGYFGGGLDDSDWSNYLTARGWQNGG
ncbi:Cell wall assembly and cell proliferation coordinating protein, KNR4-like domain protein [Rhodopirellula sallentina SM41]|uniref:Cell wall assembly and cell proliferation coordinating protein, KNR4-like domain protein n=2 Tax=Rhodopirellula TaxID=265488 RepID=M5UL82_9BACT|nr:Cell wall assembly and cell proliferation coordinating protein, KNR4-like domain protein [Rhodopirellula sallentina SM41]